MEIKKYKIIYADPAWSYKDKALYGNRGAGCKYNVMSVEEIKSIPVSEMSDKDCILFMWVTMPKLNECFDVIKAWGFEYKTVAFTWVKLNKNKPTPFMGMGRWTRANAELCLLATKGRPTRISASVRSIIETPIEKHSKKPDEIRNRIIDLVGDLPRIELFSRCNIPGWDSWGDEIDSDIEIKKYYPKSTENDSKTM